MKYIILAMALVSSSAAFSFELNSGLYVSEEGCEVEVSFYEEGHPRYEAGSVRLDYSYPSDEDPEYRPSSYSVFSHDYFEMYKWSGLCGDDEANMPSPILHHISKGGKEVVKHTCGDQSAQIYDILEMKTDGNGGLAYFEYKSSVAKYSLSPYLYLPFVQEVQNEMVCTDFQKVK